MWNKVFDVHNPFWQSMGTVFDLFILNTIWLICCIPVVTIGPATTAACYALIQRARREDISITKDFFHSFRENLKQGILLGLLITLTGAFLAFDIYLCRRSGTGIYTFFMVFFGIVFIFWAFTALYSFPLLAKFERKNTEIIIWAFTLSIKNLSMTLTMLFVIIAGIWGCHIIPGLIFIVPGLCTQFCATIFASILKPFLPKPFWMEDSDSSPVSSPAKDNTYADFDEAAFYGYDPSEVEKLLNEGKKKEADGAN